MDDNSQDGPYAPKPEGFDIAMAVGTLTGDATLRYREVDVTASTVDGKRVFFATDKLHDPIQRAHRHGSFFEPEEMEFMREFIPEGATFVDIGANVGNHTLFAGLVLGAGRIIPFEPNPLAYRLLTLNALLNRIEDRVVFDYIGYGVSDTEEEGFGMTERRKNLGAARMVKGEGDISTLRGDTALAGESPCFVKIDVEGMEIGVLRGLEETFARCRPVVLIEVDRTNDDAFEAWRVAHRYAIRKTIQHYEANRNFLLLPEERG